MDYSKSSNDKKRKKTKQSIKKGRNKAGVLIFRVLLSACIIGAFAAVGIVLGAYMGIIENAPDLSDYTTIQPQNYASIVYDKNGVEIDRYSGEENREYVSLAGMGSHMKNAIIAIEDERFYTHNGVDMRGILRAAYSTLTGDRQGASTITQQLIKNNITKVLVNDMKSKLKEQYLAVKLEERLTEQLGSKQKAKDYILESYLNSIFLNHGRYGVQAASNYYFGGKNVDELTITECAVIAAITNRPTAYTPIKYPEYNHDRVMLILDKMLELKFITQEEYDISVADADLSNESGVYSRVTQFNGNTSTRTDNYVHDYFSDALLEDIKDALIDQQKAMTDKDAYNMIYNGGLQIYTTKDSYMQGILEETFNDDSYFPTSDYYIDVVYYLTAKNTITDVLENYEEKTTVKSEDEINAFTESIQDKYLSSNMEWFADRVEQTVQPQASMIIMDYYTGYVRALIGGRGEKTTNRGFNRATQSRRQPGSVFKVLTSYAPAIDMGLVSAGSIIVDEPITIAEYNNYSPGNWTGTFQGPVTVRDGIVNSMNVVTVKVMMMAGVDACFDYLKSFGFKLVDREVRNGQVFSDRGPATALGGLTDGVTQKEVTAAYGTIANGGVYQKPTLFTSVLGPDNEVLLEYIPEDNRHEVLKSSTAYVLTDIMQGVVTRGTGGKARFKNIKMPISGKTGTSQNTKDLTFVGFTPYYVAGIWLGHDADKYITEDRGHHMLIWSHVMETIHENLEYKDFERPANLTSVSICSDSGKLPVSGLCSNDIRGSRVRTDLLSGGGVPSEYCDIHVSVTIDSASGYLASPDTPDDRKKTIVGIMVADDKITTNDYEIPAAMVSGSRTTKLNANYTGIVLPDKAEGEYMIDPDTGEMLLIPPNIVDPQPTSTPAQPQFPSFLNTPAPEATATPEPQFPGLLQPTPTPVFSDIPPYIPPENNVAPTLPPADISTTIPTENLEVPTRDKPPIIE